MNIAPRPLIPVLLGTVLLAASACDDGEPPQSAGDPSAGVQWTGYAKGCPEFPGEEPGKRTAAAYSGPTFFSVRCQYRPTGAKQERIALSVTVYRAASGGSTAEQLASGAMEKVRATAAETVGVVESSPSADADPVASSPSPPAETQPIEGLGDGAFARLVPQRGVRVYVRSANAMVQLDYSDLGDRQKALTTATDLTRQALTGLR